MSLPSAYPLDTDLLVVVAAGRASSGDLRGALALCQRCEVLGDEEAGSRAVDLLLSAGDRDHAVQLAVVGSHSAKPGADRRRWRALAKGVVPDRDARDWVELGAGVLLFVALALLGLPGILLAAAVVWVYRTFVRRLDRDPVTNELLRAHRNGAGAETRIPAADGFVAFFGSILGMMAGAALMGGNEQSAALAATTFAAPTLLVPVALVAARRWAARRLLGLADERNRRLTDKTCRCYGTVGFRGPSGRRYVSAHLSPAGSVQGGSSSLLLLRCPSTGMPFLDVQDRGVTVAVQPRTTEPATNDLGIGQYL